MKVEATAEIEIVVHVAGTVSRSRVVEVDAIRLGGLDITGAVPANAVAVCEEALLAAAQGRDDEARERAAEVRE